MAREAQEHTRHQPEETLFYQVMSDKPQLLPVVALLRTVQASFPAHGSSL